MTASLRALQERLLAALSRATPLGLADTDVAKAVRASARLSPTEHLEIYRAQLFGRHVACLGEDFPTLVAVLGEAGFERLAGAYLEAHPPASFSLRDLGAGVAAFVATREGLAHRDVLADAASLDWAFVDAFDAATMAPLDRTKLREAGEAIAGARLVTCPSLRLIVARFPVHALRAAIVDEADQPPILTRTPTFLVVHRPRLAVEVFALPALAFGVLCELRAGAIVGEALDRIAAELADVDADALAGSVGGWFRDWAERDVIRDVVLPAGSVLGRGDAGVGVLLSNRRRGRRADSGARQASLRARGRASAALDGRRRALRSGDLRAPRRALHRASRA